MRDGGKKGGEVRREREGGKEERRWRDMRERDEIFTPQDSYQHFVHV